MTVASQGRSTVDELTRFRNSRMRADAVAAVREAVLHGWPGFADDGSPLDTAAVTERRDAFLSAALEQLV